MNYQPLKTYGRRGGRPISARQQRLMETCLPKLQIIPGRPGSLQPATLFSKAEAIWLEIGFGGGEHVSQQAARAPQTGFLASEVFREGVAKLMGQIEDLSLNNVRIFDQDARRLVSALAPQSIDRVFILFPDPWPKARHQKRRLIQTDFLSDLARIVRPGGQLRFATDVRSYADEALVKFLAHPAYQWTANESEDWSHPPEDHIETRYQAKQLGDIAPVYYDFCLNTARP